MDRIYKLFRGKLSFLLVLFTLLFIVTACSEKEDDEETTTQEETTSTPLLTGSISSTTPTDSSSSSSSTSRATLIRPSSASRATSALSGCTINALDAKDDDVIVATTTSDSNGEYTFTSAQVSENTSYKIQVICDGNKMSTYASTGSKSNDPVSADINPKTTAIAVYVKKSILQSVASAVEGLDSTLQDAIKTAVLENIDSMIQSVMTSIEELIDDGSMTVPTTIDGASTLEDTVDDLSPDDVTGSADITTLESNLDTAETNTGSYVPPTVDTEIEGTASAGTANAMCDPSQTSTYSTAIPCAKQIAQYFVRSLHWSMNLEGITDTSSDIFGINGNSCDSTLFEDSGFPFTRAEVSVMSDGGACMLQSKFKATNRNEENQGDEGGPMMTDGLALYFANSLRSGEKITLAQLDTIMTNWDTSDLTKPWGWNMRVLAYDYKYNFYTYGGTNNSFVLLPQDNYINLGFNSPYEMIEQHLDPSGDYMAWDFDATADGSAAYTISAIQNYRPQNIFVNEFSGTVPTLPEIKQWIDESRSYLDHNPAGAAENNVIITGERHYGPLWDENTGAPLPNPCEDQNSNTSCYLTDGTTLAEDNAVKVQISFSVINDASSDLNGFRRVSGISDPTTDDFKNFYVMPDYDQYGATGAFRAVNVATGKQLRSPLGNEIVIAAIDDVSWCNSSTSRFGDLSCTLSQVGKAVELWVGYSQGQDGWQRTYSQPVSGTSSFLDLSNAGTVGAQINSARRTSFKTKADPMRITWQYWDGSQVQTASEEFELWPLAWGESDDLEILQFSIDPSTDTPTVDANGTYRAYQHWDYDPTTDTATPNGFVFYQKQDGGNPIFYRSTINSGANTVDIWFDGTTDTIFADSSADMITLLEGNTAYAKTVQYYFNDAPIANPNWSADQDPWLLRDETNTPKTFSEQWGVVDYVARAIWIQVDASTETTKRQNRCSYFVDSFELNDFDGSGDTSGSGNLVNLQDLCNNVYSNTPTNINGYPLVKLSDGSAVNYTGTIFSDSYFEGPFGWLRAINWDDDRIQRRKTGYNFANPEGAFKILTYAFPGEFFDGKHTINATTEFNILQIMSFLFLRFEQQEYDPLNYEGFDPNSQNYGQLPEGRAREWVQFGLMSPMWFTGNDDKMFEYFLNGFNRCAPTTTADCN